VVTESGGTGEHASDPEIVDGIKLLAVTEGIFAETAGGVTVAATKQLVEHGVIGKDDLTVVCVTGNGLKTQEAVDEAVKRPMMIGPTLKAFDDVLAQAIPAAATGVAVQA
jgi:threonine synthase